MKKNVLKIGIVRFLIVSLVSILLYGLTSCAPKRRRTLREVGAATVSAPIRFGVQTSKGTDSNAAPVYVADIYYPTGLNENGVQVFNKLMYEMEKLTPGGLDEALKNLEILDKECLFCDLRLYKVNDEDALYVGPGGSVDAKLNQAGIVRYVYDLEDANIDFTSPLINEEDYEGKTGKDLKGKISGTDIIKAITMTFQENYQLVDCDFEAATYNDWIDSNGEDVTFTN